MSRPGLVHLVFTNLAGAGGSGYRHLWTADWSAEERVPVESWLQAVTEAAAERPGYAGAPFRAAGRTWRALARAESGTASDEFGRHGRLGHALLAEVAEGAGLEAGERLLATLERAWEGGGSRGDLAGLWRRCEELDVLDPGPPAAGRASVPADDPLLAHVLAASAARGHVPHEAAVPAGGADAAADLLRRLDLLPPRLRLSLRWSTVEPAPPETALVLRTAAGATAPRAELPPVAGRYRELIGRAPDELTGDWSIRSWRDVGERLEGAGVE